MWDQAVSDGARALSGGGHWQVGRRIRRVRLAGCAGSWAAGRRAGPAGERERGEEVDRAGLGRGRGVGRGKAWADLGCWDGLVGLVFFFGFCHSISLTFLNLIQTKFEFKFEFEFKPHSNKIYAPACMQQKKFKLMINFN